MQAFVNGMSNARASCQITSDRRFLSRICTQHSVLPGLQFNLNGIIGNPVAFYTVPAVRFAYDLLSYM